MRAFASFVIGASLGALIALSRSLNREKKTSGTSWTRRQPSRFQQAIHRRTKIRGDVEVNRRPLFSTALRRGSALARLKHEMAVAREQAEHVQQFGKKMAQPESICMRRYRIGFNPLGWKDIHFLAETLRNARNLSREGVCRCDGLLIQNPQIPTRMSLILRLIMCPIRRLTKLN